MKTIKFLSMAALALVGAVMTGCSSDDEIIETPQQPVNSQNVETLTTTVGFDEVAETRALTSGGVKTFAAGDKLALVYKNTSGETVKTESAALPSGSYSKSATFTFELVNADKTKNVTYIYPASMANNDGTINYDALTTQNGTLATLSSSLDLATYAGAWNGTSLPAGTLVNQLAVCALTLKDNATPTPNPITSGLTQVIVSDGSNTYTVTPTSSTFGEDVIYVAIRPVTAALEYTATDGTKNYTKTATSREYAAGNFYNLGLRMVEPVPAATGHALSASEVGEIVCSDGLAYDAADKDNLPQGVTAVAMIAYVGTASDCTTGLAIALEDVSSSTYTWADAAEAVTTWATGKTPPTTGSWRLPSIKDWQYMFIGCGSGESYSDPEVGMDKSYVGLREKLAAAGGTDLEFGWSSTEVEDYDEFAWWLNFDGGFATFFEGFKDNDDENQKHEVRSCLAF